MDRPKTLKRNRMNTLRDLIHRHPLALALTAALLFRLYGLHIVKILNNDVIFYLDLTRRLSESGFFQGIREIAALAYTPLYPLMIHALDAMLQDTLWAAVGVSFIFGTLCMIPFFIAARNIFDDRKALIASLLFAANSYFVRYSVYVIRDMTALFFFFSSAAIVTSRKPGKAWRSVGFGLAALMAVSIRPEYILIYALSWAIYLLTTKRWKTLVVIGLSLSVFISAMKVFRASPEIALLRLILLERVAAGLARFGTHLQAASFPASLWSAVAVSFRSLVELLGLLTPIAGVVSLLGAGHAVSKWRTQSGERKILLTAASCATILYTVWGSVGGYFTRRFLILPGGLLLMFAGDGVDVIRGWARRRPQQAVTVSLILLFSSVTIHTLFHEVGGRREGLKLAGLHIFRTWQERTRPTILSDERIIAFYARGTHAPLEETGSREAIESLLRNQRIDYMILKVIPSEGPGEEVEKLVQRGSVVLDTTLPYGERDGNKREIRIYRIRFDSS